MAAARTPDEIRREIEVERKQLAGAVEHLRGELGQAANIKGRLKSKLPVVAAGAATAGFVRAGGVGAAWRYVARRVRGSNRKPRAGRWSIFNRD